MCPATKSKVLSCGGISEMTDAELLPFKLRPSTYIGRSGKIIKVAPKTVLSNNVQVDQNLKR